LPLTPTIEGYERIPELRFWGRAPRRTLVALKYIKDTTEFIVMPVTKSKLIRGTWEIKVATPPPPGTYDWVVIASKWFITIRKSEPFTATV